MTVQDVRKLDDDDIRANVQLAAKGGDDNASILLFFWAQWRKIDTTKNLSGYKKVMLLADLIKSVNENFNLRFTYGS